MQLGARAGSPVLRQVVLWGMNAGLLVFVIGLASASTLDRAFASGSQLPEPDGAAHSDDR